MSETISCVITSYNNGAWLKQSVASVLAQTRPVDEIVIADDASNDGSRDLIAALAKQYKQITPIFRERNLGVAANRDLAVREASGTWITTLDGDDFYLPEKIEAEWTAIETAGGDGVAYSDVCWVDESGRPLHGVTYYDFPSMDKATFIRTLLMRESSIPRDMLYTKALYLETGGYRHEQKILEDWDLKLRLVRDAARWVHSAVVGMAYRDHANGLSKSAAADQALARVEVVMANRAWLERYIGVDAVAEAVAANAGAAGAYRRADDGDRFADLVTARDRSPDDADHLAQTGAEQFGQGKFAAAVRLFREAVALRPALANQLRVLRAHAEILGMPWAEVQTQLPPGTSFPHTTGWLTSLHRGEPVNADGEPVPWFTYPAIDFIERKIAPDFKVFEWGSGNSTLWWAGRVAEVHAVDDNPLWYDKVRARLPANAKLTFAENDDAYVDAISGYGDGYFDVIVIDGSARNECAARAARYLKHGGFIVFDNSDRNAFADGVAHLDTLGFLRVDFFGLIPCYLYKNCTTVMFRDSGLLSGGVAPAARMSSVGLTCSQALDE